MAARIVMFNAAVAAAVAVAVAAAATVAAAVAALYNYTLEQHWRVGDGHMAFIATRPTYEPDNRTSEIRTLLRKLPATFRSLCLLDCGI